MAEEVPPTSLHLCDLAIDGREVGLGRVLALQPLQLLGDQLRLEQQGLDLPPRGLIQWLDRNRRPLTRFEPLAPRAAVA